MPSPTDFNLLSAAPKGAAVQARERLSSSGSGANDFQRLMDKSPKASSALESETRSRSKPRSAQPEPERQPSSPKASSAPDRPSPLEARETRSAQVGGDSKVSSGLAEVADSDQALSKETDLSADWLQEGNPLEALVQLENSELAVSSEASGLSLDQLLKQLKHVLEQLDSGKSEQAQELRSLLGEIEQGAEAGGWPAVLQQLSAGLAGLMAEQKATTPAGNPQLFAQLQGLEKALNNIQLGTNKVETNAPEGVSLELEPGAKLAWSKLAPGLGENPEAGLLDKNALDKALDRGPAKTSSIITQLSGAELGNGRIPQLQPAERSFMVQSDVRVPVGQPQWSQAVGERVLWLAAQNLTSAELRLDPPDLGPMQVRVTMNNDQVNVSFSSQQVAVREALDQGAQRLREMFNEQGLKLGDVNVSDQSEGRQFGRDRETEGQGRRGSGAGEEDDAPLIQSQLVSMRLVDHYA